ncbi:MAG: hypothetical protein H7841_17265, partial [Magnetospirillum sp. WYHS-4]
MVRFPRLATLTLTAFLAATIGARADSVAVKGAPHEDYGRLVFAWELPVKYSATVKGDQLVVTFGRPIDASYAGAVKALAKYIKDAKPSADKKQVTFTLTGPFGARAFDTGAAVVVDITGQAPKTEPKPEPRKAEAKPPAKPTADPTPGTPLPTDLPALKVRIGEHADYTRVVFDWPKEVDYGVADTDQGTVVIFARGARPDLSRLKSDPPPFIRGASAEMKGKRLAVTLNTVPGATIKHFLSGKGIVIDVGRPTPDSLAKAQAKPAPAAAPAADANKPTALTPPVPAPAEALPAGAQPPTPAAPP